MKLSDIVKSRTSFMKEVRDCLKPENSLGCLSDADGIKNAEDLKKLLYKKEPVTQDWSALYESAENFQE